MNKAAQKIVFELRAELSTAKECLQVFTKLDSQNYFYHIRKSDQFSKLEEALIKSRILLNQPEPTRDVAFSETPCCHTNAWWIKDAYYCEICNKQMSEDFD